MKVERTLGLILLLSFPAVAAPEPAAKRAAFATVPKQALVELKATVGKPFSAGLVFVNGKFLDPPYKVERYGTALRINGIQVTNEIVPWTEFLKTQPGARVEKVETPQSADAPAAEPAPAAEEPEAEESYDSSDDIDDLFDDDPKPKKKAAKPTVAKRPAKAAPPPPATTIVFDGEFKPNDKTRQMVARINKARTRVETTLRNGGCYFFGARYMPFSVDRLPTEMLLSSLPDVMKSNTVFEQFSSAARAKGLTFISENVMRELFRNRLDYIRLQARAKAVKEGGKWGTTL